MKVCVLYFGVPRNTAICMPSIQKNLIEPLRTGGFTIEERCHLFLQSEINNSRSQESGVLSGVNYNYFMNLHGSIEPINRGSFDEQLKYFQSFGDAWEDGYRSTGNLLMQFHSLRQVTKLFEQTDSDFALFVRPDIYYMDPILPSAVEKYSSVSRVLAVPPWQWHNGLNDRMAFCSREAAITYGYRGDLALNYCKESRDPLHAERFLAHVMNEARTDIRILDVRAERVRINGRHEAENFDSYATAGGRKAKIRLSWAYAKSGLTKKIKLSEIHKKEVNL